MNATFEPLRTKRSASAFPSGKAVVELDSAIPLYFKRVKIPDAGYEEQQWGILDLLK